MVSNAALLLMYHSSGIRWLKPTARDTALNRKGLNQDLQKMSESEFTELKWLVVKKGSILPIKSCVTTTLW